MEEVIVEIPVEEIVVEVTESELLTSVDTCMKIDALIKMIEDINENHKEHLKHGNYSPKTRLGLRFSNNDIIYDNDKNTKAHVLVFNMTDETLSSAELLNRAMVAFSWGTRKMPCVMALSNRIVTPLTAELIEHMFKDKTVGKEFSLPIMPGFIE